MREYWAVRLNGGYWLSEEQRPVAKHFRGKFTRDEARGRASDWPIECKLVHVARKPKAPPPLAIEDEVVVRGTVKQVEPPLHPRVESPDVFVQFDNVGVWLNPKKLERVKP